MSDVVTYDAYPHDDPVGGERLVRFTQLKKGTYYRRELKGTGRGKIVMNVNSSEATAANLHKKNFVRTYNLALCPTEALATSAAADDEIDTTGAHGLIEGDLVEFTALTGGAGLEVDAAYWVVDVPSATAFKVAWTKVGAPIDFTTNISAGVVRHLSKDFTEGGGALGGFFLTDFDFDPLSADLEGGRNIAKSGPGSLSLLGRGVLPDQARSPDGGPFDQVHLDADGAWLGAWAGVTPLGAIARRMIFEAALLPDSPFPQITQDTIEFGGEDSDGNPTPIFVGKYQEPISNNLLEALGRLMRSGGFFLRLLPDLTRVRAYMDEEYGVDQTGTSFGAGVVRFTRDDNILAAAGGEGGSPPRRAGHDTERSHALIGVPGTWTTVTAAGVGDDVIDYVGLAANPDELTDMDGLAVNHLRDRQASADVIRLPVASGDDPDNGRYTAGKHYIEGNYVTLFSGTGPWDWEDATQRIATIEWVKRDAGDDDVVLEFGSIFLSTAAATVGGTRTGRGTCICLKLCDCAAVALPVADVCGTTAVS